MSRLLIVTLPEPGMSHTRATASLRRPVAYTAFFSTLAIFDCLYESALARRLELVLGRLLRPVGVLGAGVDLELLDDHAAERALGEHAPDRAPDDVVRVLHKHLARRLGPEAAHVERVLVIELVVLLVARQVDLL